MNYAVLAKNTMPVLLLMTLFNLTSCSQAPLGLQLYTFRNEIPKDVPGTFEKISKMGFRYLEGGETNSL